jgi:hypothetical protein
VVQVFYIFIGFMSVLRNVLLFPPMIMVFLIFQLSFLLYIFSVYDVKCLEI